MGASAPLGTGTGRRTGAQQGTYMGEELEGRTGARAVTLVGQWGGPALLSCLWGRGHCGFTRGFSLAWNVCLMPASL